MKLRHVVGAFFLLGGVALGDEVGKPVTVPQGPAQPSCETELGLKSQYVTVFLQSNIKLEGMLQEAQQQIAKLTKERDEALLKSQQMRGDKQ